MTASSGDANPGAGQPGGAGALARLAHRFDRAPNPDGARGTEPHFARPATRHAALGPESHPFADIARLAALLAGDDPAPEGQAGALPPSPGPAAVALEAAKHGLEAICQSCNIASLTPQDAPLVVLLATGGSRLVIAIDHTEAGEPFAVLATAAGEVRADLDVLAEAASGTVFRMRLRAAESGIPPEGASARTARRPLQDSVVHSAAGIAGMQALLVAALRERRPLIVQLVIASTLINLCGLALPLFTMAVFDRVIPHAAMETLFALGLGVCLALALEFALRHARLKLFDAVGQSASLSLQGRLMGRLLFGRLGDVPRAPGAIMPPAQEMDQLAQAGPQLAVALLCDLPFFLLLMILIASIAGPVALVPLIGTMGMVALHVVCHRLAEASHGAQSGFLKRQTQALIEGVAAQERIRLTGAGGRFFTRWERAADEAGFASHQMRYWHGIAAQGSAVLVQMVVVAAVIIGVFRIEAAAMTIGALSASILLVNRAMMPVSILTGLIFRVMQGLRAAAPLEPLLSAAIEAGADRRAGGASIAGRIELARVSFTYPGAARPALKDVTLAIRPGEKVGLIGKAGCGKSTLLKLIACLHEPQEGRIALDGRDIRQFDPADIRRAIASMPQDSALVDGTIEENMTLGLPPVPRAELERIAALSGVDEIIRGQPSGYSVQVGPGGQALSGGERQCVSLARALMGRPAMLLLDEPTSAFDNTLEARILAALKQELVGRGLIVATHRLQVLALVDRVIWIEGGRIAADGPKDEIFRKFGLVSAA